MSVNTEDLENGERGLDLNTRDVKGAKKVAADIQRVKNGTPTADDELKALRGRVAAVKATPPEDTQPHCRDCFERAWRATVAALEGEK